MRLRPLLTRFFRFSGDANRSADSPYYHCCYYYYYSTRPTEVRNIGIIAHIDAGKTTTTERMLFYAGLTRRIGDVDRGDTVTDYLPEERARGITITAAAITFPWRDASINLIDTPGHVDFGMEVERSLRVLDGAVVVLDGSAGVQAQTRTVWRQADRWRVPRIVFVNKMDKTGADLGRVLGDLSEAFGNTAAMALQVPVITDSRLEAIIDLVQGKRMVWRDPLGRDMETSDEFSHVYARMRTELMERLAEFDDRFLEQYLDDPASVSAADIDATVRRLTIAGRIVPVLCGSSFRNIGVQPLLDAIIKYLPRPEEPSLPTRYYSYVSGGLARGSLPGPEHLVALAFKVIHDEQRGLLVFLRIYAGTLTVRTTLRNNTQRIKERPVRLFRIQANRFEEIEEAGAGSVVVLLGMKRTRTGDTLTESSSRLTEDILLEHIHPPQPVFTCSVEAESNSDEAHLEHALSIVELEDPSVRVSRDPETGQKHLSGMGELHLEIVGRRLTRDLKAKAVFGPVQIAHKEVLSLPEETLLEERMDSTLGGRRLVAGLQLKLASSWTESSCPPSRIAFETQLPAIEGVKEAIEEGLLGALNDGPLAHLPLVSLAIVVRRCEWAEGLSTPDAFRQLAFTTLHRFLSSHQDGRNGRLAEPLMSVEISLPTGHLGAVLSDIHSVRRGTVLETRSSATGTETTISAEIPLATMLGYATSLRSRTAGTGEFSMQPLCYRVMTADEELRILRQLGIDRCRVTSDLG